ncbi:hypothetical protein B5566_02345 [Mycobacterium sp. MHSD3]|nr:hypothetical protein B5566_02345 [Mycobacterium sp. MHSD3]
MRQVPAEAAGRTGVRGAAAMNDEPAPVVVLGKPLTPGTEVSVRGKRGARYKFLRASTVPSTGAVVLDFIGGTRNHKSWHSFYPDQISKVHAPTEQRPNPLSRKGKR